MSLFDLEDTGSDVKGYVTGEEFIAIYREHQPKVVAFDTESPTFKWHLDWAVPFALTFSWTKEHTYYVPCSVDGELLEDAANALFEVFTTAPTLVGHHLKYDLHVAKRIFDAFDMPLVVRRIDDTMIMSAMLNENRYHGLKELCTDYGISFDENDANALKLEIADWIQQTKKATGVEPGYNEVPKRLMVPYALGDAYLTLELFNLFETDMEEQMEDARIGRPDVRDIYELELRVLWILFQMEERGMRIDLDFVYQQIGAMQPQIEHIRTALTEKLGWEMNPGSTDDVAKALTQLGREDVLWLNPKTGKVNLPEWRLEALRDDETAGETVQMVLEYRTASKMLSSYFEVLAKEHHMDEHGQAIVRCNNKQTGARTGRMSVTEPALQTIPREKGEVRGAFIAREGHKLIFADYSQQELRVLAHYMEAVKDPSMADVFRAADLDLHTETAAAIFQVPYEDVTSEQRRLGKNTNFAIVYGAGAKKIGFMHGMIDDDHASKYGSTVLSRLYDRFPGLKKLKSYCTSRITERGYVVTAFGRRHREENARFAYKAVNSLVQGTSADMTKSAMVRIDDALRHHGLSSMIVLSVHDEIIVEATDEELEETVEVMRRHMLDFPEVSVPLEVDINVATRWSEAK